jgi:eukaryotic-like serine/threonine-protein kinase
MTRDDDRLAELLERWEAAAAAGLPPTPEDVCRDTPGDVAAFRNLLNQLGRIGLVTTAHHEAATPAAGFRAGRYVAQAFHAAGGLGIVYRARDEELNRPVALKCLKTAALADSPVGRRFLLEAEVTSRLEHPGIAPVHGRGQTADGRPFYAMRFVEGETLQDAARRFHGPNTLSTGERNVQLRHLLGAFVGVCQTVAYAHSRGVIHRDLKPSNIMVGPFGEVLVLDWGLARSVSTADSEETRDTRHETDSSVVSHLASRVLNSDNTPSDVTVEGRAKGSPAFMSPEQARGDWDRVGPASDIYSLGSTLYYLLAGRVPYDRRTGIDVLAQVQTGQFSPPREISADVPPALDAVCRKAMAFAPADRYETAQALADDVGRWLADEPVRAWQEPLRVRTRRWVKRHRTIVTATAATLVVGFVLLAIYGYRLDRKNTQLWEANEREISLRLAAEEQRRLADERFTLALDSTTHLVTDVQTKLIRSPATRAVRESMLRDAMSQLDQLVKSADQTRDADRIAVKAHLKLGDLYRDVDQSPTKATAEYSRGLELARALHNDYPHETDVTLDLVRALQSAGTADALVGRFAPAREFFAEAAGLLDEVGPAGEVERAGNLFRQGKLAVETGDYPTAAARLAEARSIFEKHADDDSQFALGETLLALGEAAHLAGRYTEAVTLHTAALARWQDLDRRRPGDVEVKRKRALAHDWLAKANNDLGDRNAAGAHARTFFDLAKNLADQDPDNLEAVRELALAHSDISLDMALRFDRDAAATHFTRSTELVEKLVRADPKNLAARRSNAVAWGKLAQVARARQQYPVAAARLRDAITLSRDIVATAPEQTISRAHLAAWLKELGQVHLLYLPDKDAGLKVLAESRVEWETLVRTDSTNLAWQAEAIDVCRLIGAWQGKLKKAFDRADEAYTAARSIANRIPSADRERPIVRWQIGLLHVDMAGLLLDRSKPNDAAAVLDQELAALARSAAENPKDPVTWQLLERNHGFLASLHRNKDAAKAAEHTQKAVDAARRGLALDPDRPELRRAIMLDRALLADPRMVDDPAAALTLLRDALADAPRLPPGVAETTNLRNQLAAYEARAGDCCEMLGKLKDATEHYTRALDLHMKVVEGEPTQPAARAVLAYDHRRLAEQRLWLLDFPGSVAEYEKAQAVLDGMKADKIPLGLLGQQSAGLIATNLPFVKTLPASIETLEATLKQPAPVRLDALRARSTLQLSKDRTKEVAETAEALAKEKAANGEALVRAAIEFCQLAARPGGQQYADRAVELLKQAKTAGYFRDPGAGPWLMWEPLFEPLRDKPGFQDLVKSVQPGR